ncbi:hypothetical protein SKAU_G00158430 [Synaphobranchus kaupii]|uniref:Transmembrane protein 51 n=1 Tax=Synaphobranchus kaupii TaxID=118154 RepID=A0A9Q1FI07_SYNKA|nr:hypothetical protein SKAU_G00158430 [Synaphobranchus kaupii]
MCSSRGLCGGEARQSSSSGSVSSSGSQYALCALGVGLMALGIVMIVWSVVPAQVPGNSSSEVNESEQETKGKTSSVAFVLVGAGVAMLLLAVCLSVRNKRRPPQAQGTDGAYREPGEQGQSEADPLPSYDVPSYDEAVTSGQYPVRQSNLRNSTSQLPSYEDLLQAVENEGAEPAAGTGQDPPQPGPAAEAPQPDPEPEPEPAPPVRHSTRSGRLLRPLKVRRIKSEKDSHQKLKDLRLNIRNPAEAGRVTIEPLTPPAAVRGQGARVLRAPAAGGGTTLLGFHWRVPV